MPCLLKHVSSCFKSFSSRGVGWTSPLAFLVHLLFPVASAFEAELCNNMGCLKWGVMVCYLFKNRHTKKHYRVWILRSHLSALLDDNFLAKCTVVGMVLQILAVVDSLEGSRSGYLKQQSKKNKTKKVGVSVHGFFTLALIASILHLLDFSHSDYYKQMCDDEAKIVWYLVSLWWYQNVCRKWSAFRLLTVITVTVWATELAVSFAEFPISRFLN